MSNPFTESRTAQKPLVKYASEIGWEIVQQEKALSHRRGEAGVMFYDIFAERLIALNPHILNNSNVGDVIKRIENVRSNIEGNAEVLAWIREQRSVYDQSQKRELNVRVIDFENLNNNTFQVTEEWQYTNGKYTNRADVVFLINGIPIVIVETKAAHIQEGIEKGMEQIRRYHNETPEMVVRPQLYDVPNILDFYYGVTWNMDRKNLFNWKDEEKGNFEKKVKRFFDRERILKVLHDYIMFLKKDDELRKVVLRQHQTRAAEKIIVRALERQKRRGLIWHAQGSGKTYTMITVAQELIHRPEFEKPTVIMIVDRNELETQLFGNLSAYGLEKGKGLEIAESKEHLRELLESDYRGLIVSMIHKFDRIPADICTRRNVFVLVDEAHRTTTGDLGNYLLAAVPNATFVGFTGTPIDRIAYGKGTFKVFGKDDDKGYLDKYSIAESIEDGTTVPLHYTLAPNDIRVPKDLLEKEFLNLAEAQGISDIEELNKILDKAVKLKTFLKSNDRVEKVAAFVAKHFKENVEPMGYKAFLVGVDRNACAIYKAALDKILPKEYSKVVYSPAHNDSEQLKAHYLTEDEEKKVRKAFINRSQLPKILIVTEKLLTGFDAPILYCMYLDKPMRDHTLIQAIARVNRPYEDEEGMKKPSGFVVDFVGIFDNLEKALAFDSDVVASVIKNIDVLKTRFESLMKERAPEYLEFTRGKIDDKAVERAVDAFGDKDKREAFFKLFRELEMLYEIISPDAFLRQYIDDYARLSVLYNIVRNAFSKRILVTKELMNKTEEFVKEVVTAEGLQRTLSLYKIDEHTLNVLKKDDAPDNVKVINLSKSLMQAVSKESDEQPYLIPISERAQTILEYYDDRQISTREALRDLETLLAEYSQAQKEREEKGFDVNMFSIYWVLRKNQVQGADLLASRIDGLFVKFPNFKQNIMEMRALKTELYKTLLDALGKDIELAKRLSDNIMRLRRK
ncbi:MAG: HsdR family type I site-specific deoxyribonuclease [Thaumarchaeota archaeon]|nr:HsdR family type I site-specific deoxyribonuclease [Nitrososphaerota archaeon]